MQPTRPTGAGIAIPRTRSAHPYAVPKTRHASDARRDQAGPPGHSERERNAVKKRPAKVLRAIRNGLVPSLLFWVAAIFFCFE
jgi:hypothetical protein